MSEKKPIQPKRWNPNQIPPCTVAYHFTLLDVNQDLRYCCHGEKRYGKHKNLTQHWTSRAYTKFRKTWSKNFSKQKGLCLGCPHHEENKAWGQVIQDYLAEHTED